MTDKTLIRIILLIHGGLLVFGIISFNSSKHEIAVWDLVIRYFSLPTILLSIIVTTFLYRRITKTDNAKKDRQYGLIEGLKTAIATLIVFVLIGFSYFLGFKSIIEITNRHIGQQEIFKIKGQVIDKDVLDNRKRKTFYLKINDLADKIIEIKVSQSDYERYNRGDTMTRNGMKGSLGFIYTN